MSIGSNIKRLRHEKNITQERLAEYLGITSRAISQWECDRTAPDISQIPALCHIFDVSSDVLLGIDLEKKNEEIKRYLNLANELGNQGKSAERTALLREANKRFPRDYKIMHRLANSLLCEYSQNGINENDEIFELCKRILSECTESNVRYEAIDTLATAYEYAGKSAEMLKLAKEMPHVDFSYENFMMYRWNGDDDFNEFQNYLSFLICHTVEMIELAAGQCHDNGSFIYELEDRINLWKTAVSILETMFPDGDFQIYAQLGESACRSLCSAYLKKGDLEEARRWIDKAVDFAIYMDGYDFDTLHTSPILRNYSSGGWISTAGEKHSQSIFEWLMLSQEADLLRADNWHQLLINRIENET